MGSSNARPREKTGMAILSKDLARWMVENDTSITKDTGYDGWLKFIQGPGWVPSLVGTTVTGVVSGVAAFAAEEGKADEK